MTRKCRSAAGTGPYLIVSSASLAFDVPLEDEPVVGIRRETRAARPARPVRPVPAPAQRKATGSEGVYGARKKHTSRASGFDQTGATDPRGSEMSREMVTVASPGQLGS